MLIKKLPGFMAASWSAPMKCRVPGGGDRDDQVVADREELIKVELADPEFVDQLGSGCPVVGDDIQAHGRQGPRRGRSDPAEADHSDRCVLQSPSAECAVGLPVPGPGQSILGQQIVPEGEQQRHRGVHHRCPHAVRRIGDQDAALGAGVQVDLVVAGAESRHVSQPAGVAQAVGADRGVAEDPHGVEVVELAGGIGVIGGTDPLPGDARSGQLIKADVAVDHPPVRIGDFGRDGQTVRLHGTPHVG